MPELEHELEIELCMGLGGVNDALVNDDGAIGCMLEGESSGSES